MRQGLRIHPDSHCAAVSRIEAEVVRPSAGRLVLNYVVAGRIGDLRMPPAAEPVRTDELWRHSCFEAFVRTSQRAAYYEFNFAPSTRWAAYRFSGYRNGMRAATELAAPRIAVQSSPTSYRLQATLDLDQMDLGRVDLDRIGLDRIGLDQTDLDWRIGLSAVIEDVSGNKSYWALAHPPGEADFHHADGFALELPNT
jgi:hypothetical protein